MAMLPWLDLGHGARCKVSPACCGPTSSPEAWRDFFAALPGLLVSPAATLLTIGRHTLHRLPAETLPAAVSSAAIPAFVVKTYGPQALWRDVVACHRPAGTKAARAFDIALRLQSANVGTPVPIAAYEQWQGARLVRSHFLSAFVPDLTDFRVELNRLLSAHPAQCAPIIDLLQLVADAVAAFHRAGILHRDLGNQNIALQPLEAETATTPARAPFRVLFLDLNRAIPIPPPGPTDAQRGVDLSRLDIPSDLRRVFFAMLHGGHDPSPAFTRAEKRARAAFDRHTALRPFRHPFREARIRKAERDLPRPPSGRALWIWDERSAQPVQAYTSRDRRRYLPVANVRRAATSALRYAAPVAAAEKRLSATSFTAPVPFANTIGVSLEWTTGDRQTDDISLARAHWQAQLAALAPLDAAASQPLPVHIRLYAHRPAGHTDALLAAAAALHAAAPARPIAFTLLQDRPSVSTPARWTDFLSRVLPAIAPYADAIQFTHALNRSKWGLWDYAEAAALFAPLPRLLSAYPDLRILLPFGIDFEPYAFRPLSAHFPAFPDRPPALRPTPSCALYVDRRGPPEATQHHRDLPRKLAALRALAEAGPAARTAFRDLPDSRLTITEANWPLLDTDAWSPVSSPYETLGPRRHNPAVPPATYAAYMARYLLLAIASGHARRVYWWRLAAHGFGILDAPPDLFPAIPLPPDQSVRDALADNFTHSPDASVRPAYYVLLSLLRHLSDATFTRLEQADGTLRLHFATPCAPLVATWSPTSASPPTFLPG
ncbi:MAG: hypothetical protein IJT88_03575 [Kiritimatiellae bacterium]|nr:hypothetical protein [Kiritimatiellia bacterium]